MVKHTYFTSFSFNLFVERQYPEPAWLGLPSKGRGTETALLPHYFLVKSCFSGPSEQISQVRTWWLQTASKISALSIRRPWRPVAARPWCVGIPPNGQPAHLRAAPGTMGCTVTPSVCQRSINTINTQRRTAMCESRGQTQSAPAAREGRAWHAHAEPVRRGRVATFLK